MEDLPIFDSNVTNNVRSLVTDTLQDDGRESQRKQIGCLSDSTTQAKHAKITFSVGSVVDFFQHKYHQELEAQDPLSLPPTRKFGGWGQESVTSGQAAYGR